MTTKKELTTMKKDINVPLILRRYVPALEFDGIDIGFLEKPTGIGHGHLVGLLVAHKGHITNDKSGGRSTAHRLAVHNTLVHGDRHGARITVYAHAHGIANEDHLDTGRFLELSCGKVVAGQPANFLAVCFFFV